MAPRRSEQASIRLVLQRAGTSKGLFLHEKDLPTAGPLRDRLLARLMGSPDVLQVDGLGGSRPITSKVAIVGVSQREDADVDYTFAQVDIASAGVGYAGNCGNISSGVGPFAVDEGLVEVCEGVTRVRIYNANTDKLLIADVPVRDGVAAVEGSYVVPGVPGSGAEIAMNWVATIGSATGKLLPTGSPSDPITLEDGRRFQASLVDAGNPCVWIRGEDLGLSGTETQGEINKDAALRAAVGEVRAKAAVLFGFAGDWKTADVTSPGLPMLGLVSPPVDYETINGVGIGRNEMDLRLHLIFMGVLHESVAGTGSICLAAASRIPGSTVYETAGHPHDWVLRIGHPSGVTPAVVEAEPTGEAPYVAFRNLGFSRTARRLMDGRAYYPRSLLDEGTGLSSRQSDVSGAHEMRENDHSSWTAADLSADQSWSYTLGNKERDALLAELRRVYIPGKALFEYSPDEIDLGPAAGVMDEALRQTVHGRGVALVSNLPRDGMTEEEFGFLTWMIGLKLGVARPQGKPTQYLSPVRNTGAAYRTVTGRGYNSNSELDYHVDGSDVVALTCYNTAKAGGMSTCVSTRAIHNAMAAEAPDLLKLLYDAYVFNRQGEEASGEPPTVSIPIFSERDGRLFGRWVRNRVDSAQKRDDVPKLDERHREALDVLDAIIRRPEYVYEMWLKPGDMQLLNNHFALHSRTEFEDFEQPEQRRLLFRLWLSPPDMYALPDGLARAFGSAAPNTVRGGILGQAYDEACRTFDRRLSAYHHMRPPVDAA